MKDSIALAKAKTNTLHGAIATPTTPQEYTAFIEAELAKWAPVLRSSGAKMD